jgi:hypothetical protein
VPPLVLIVLRSSRLDDDELDDVVELDEDDDDVDDLDVELDDELDGGWVVTGGFDPSSEQPAPSAATPRRTTTPSARQDIMSPYDVPRLPGPRVQAYQRRRRCLRDVNRGGKASPRCRGGSP